MNRWIVVFCVFVVASRVTAQEKKAYVLPTPEGWTAEPIKLPPEFAPMMKWKGVEELRFAPGMFDPKSNSFFSYVAMFWIPGKQQINTKVLEEQLLLYYRGLAKAKLKGKGKVDFDAFALKMASPKPTKVQRRDGDTVRQFVGTLVWFEPFATKKYQRLRISAHSWYCAKAKHHCIFLCISPQKMSSEIWNELRTLRKKFRCVGK